MLDKLPKKTFCGFSMGRNQYWAGRVYDLCVYYMTGTPEGSTESGSRENRCSTCGQRYHCDLQKNETILILISLKRYFFAS